MRPAKKKPIMVFLTIVGIYFSSNQITASPKHILRLLWLSDDEILAPLLLLNDCKTVFMVFWDTPAILLWNY
jgi:hypothetical protein